MRSLLKHPFVIRMLHWEYWSSTLIYLPLYPYWLWLSIRARSFFFLTAANPAIRNGGFIMERKTDVYNLLPSHLYPTTVLIQNGTDADDALLAMQQAGITFPIIAKPDIGERGLGVKKILNRDQLCDYAARMPVPWLIQEFVSWPHEAGIFYYRLPGTDTGHITGIVNKSPVCVTGDGTATIADLVKKHDRYILQWQQIATLCADKLHTIPATGETVILLPYGNHSRGSMFTDETFRVTQKLTDTIHRICSQIPEFYYGRLDIRFDSWEALERGEDISIIEVNGSGSEPTHIYDPEHSIFFAWREIIKHWKILYTISSMNNKKGVPYLSLSQGRKEVASFREIDALLSVRVW